MRTGVITQLSLVPPSRHIFGTYVHPRAWGAADAAASRAATVSKSSSCFAFLLRRWTEGSPEAEAGVVSSFACVCSLPDWLGAAVSCDPWSAGPIIRRPLGEIHFRLCPVGVLCVVRRDDDVCVAPETSRCFSGLAPLRGPSINRSKSIPQAQSMFDSRFLAGIGGPASPCGVDMEIEYDLFFRKVDTGNVF